MEVIRKRNNVVLCGLVLGLWSCAQISAPTGGPKDETPPQVILFDPPNERVNIRPHQLLMEFDEYVVVRNVQQMLIVSPPIAKAPTWRVRGKKVEWTFDPAEFAEDRTYVFSFGSSIVDLHESNPATDLKWAFSTGSDLDTLKARGNVIDRMTGQGKKGLRVLLFHAPAEWDSIWAGQRPDALGETDADGTFSIPYLADRSFVGLALDDVNGNYVWDEGEYVALDSTPFRGGSMELKWLGEETEKPLLRPSIESCKVDTTGMIRILAAAPEEITSKEEWQVIWPESTKTLPGSREGDSVFVWVDVQPGLDWQEARMVWSGLDFADTARIRTLPGAPGLANWKAMKQPKGFLKAGKERAWFFQRGIQIADSTKFKLLEDSVDCPMEFFRASTAAKTTRELRIGIAEKEGVDYQLEVLPGALRTRTGIELGDTLSYRWKTRPTEYFGELVVSLTEVPGAGWLRINDERVWVHSDSVLRFQKMEPATVTLGFEWDMNGDSIWQTVDPKTLRSAEPYFRPENQPKVRSNWVIEWNWSLLPDTNENSTE